ncbi:MAG: cation transporter [Lachnospiraceae bacterium]|nr:cation transporter [Lachnospiraceae bacterium]
MITLLARIFVKEDLPISRKRELYGTLTSMVGIFLNLLISTLKFIAGSISRSVSMTADAANNLSDAGSSIVALLGFKLASQKPDADHPYGHGRIEYLSGGLVSGVIIAMGLGMIRESLNKIIHPQDMEWSLLSAGILVFSILVKAYMAYYNHKVGKQINSPTVMAVSADALGDCGATTAVLLASLIFHFFGVNIDGYAGCVVSVFILIAGYTSMKETISPLLGTPPDPEFVEEIRQVVLNYDSCIIGCHDLMVHDYGPGRRIISLHAEVPASSDILTIHDVIDNLEKKLQKEVGCIATIHMDPVITDDPATNRLKEDIHKLVQEIHEEVTIHDFRVVWGDSHTNVIFDMAVPFDCRYTDEEIRNRMDSLVKEKINENFFCVITVDRGSANL